MNIFFSLYLAPTNVSTLQHVENLDFVHVLKFSGLTSAPQTVLHHSPEVKETHINISAGINSFDLENSDINIV